MTAKTDNAEPSEEDAAKALETLRRFQYNSGKREFDRKQPLRDILESDAYQRMRELLAAVPDDLAKERFVAPFLSAIASGLDGLERVTPTVVPTIENTEVKI